MKETFQTKAKQVSEIFKEYIGCVELTNISGDDNLDEGAYSFKHMLHQKGVSDENIENIFQEIKKRKTKNKKQILIKIRDLCIVKLLFYTGLRVSELLALKKEDLKDDMIQIVGK